MMNEANNNAAAEVGAQTVHAPLCEARQGSATFAMAQAKKHTLKQPMKQAIKQVVGELGRWCKNTAHDQNSKASSSIHVRNSSFRWYSSYCSSVLTTNTHP
jgi:hypothetical protein